MDGFMRRRGFVEADGGDEWKIVIDSSRLSYQKRCTANGLYYVTDNKRVSYIEFDIPIEYGYIYKFEYIASSVLTTSNIGLQFYNEDVVQKVNAGQSFSNANIYDPGWQSNGTEITVPQLINGYPIAGVRLTFRGNNGNYAFSNGSLNEIEKVTITRRSAT